MSVGRSVLPRILVVALVAACAGGPQLASPSPTPETPVRTPTALPATSHPASPTPPPASPTPAPPTPSPASPSPEPTAEAPAVEGRIVNREQGYALTLPEGWLRLDLDERFMGALAEELGGEAVDELVEVLGEEVRSLIRSGISLIAFRRSELLAGDFATNLNVLAAPSGGMSIDALEQLNVSQIQQLPGLGGEISSERVQLPAGESLYLVYSLADETTTGETHQ